ncbi:pentatricopeptide repeat-containing protein [Arabidopsis lyrata subsp. lyrata]|uniref:Pentatricopeptide repeat-containing protein n=2 Tax=Arabidopsis lyrata subsp. lyrata TaxID=81972 RepID=D7L2Q7_ARALL|nr:pentatricopeptide repeat-containing protein [Arabidopsis lyrata subsp. lyrata]
MKLYCSANEVRSRTLATLRQLRQPPPATRRVDARIIKTGFNTDTCRSNFTVEDLLRRGQVSAALKVYDEMPHKNTVSTNTMISGYVKMGDLSSARHLFDAMPDRTVVTWTILMGWYAGNNHFDEAFKLFRQMCRSCTLPDYVTFTTLLPGCNDAVPQNAVGQVHAFAVKLGFDTNLFLTVCNVLLKSYCEVRRLDLACVLFEEILDKDSVTFNTLITGYEKDGLYTEAIHLFLKMRQSGHKPSDFTFSGVLKAVVGLHDFALGQQLHGLSVTTGFSRDASVGNQILHFYSKHDRVLETRNLFNEMPELDFVSYNVVISSYSQAEQYEESLNLFREMQCMGFDRRNFPFATMLSIAANLSSLQVGRQVHCQAIVATADSILHVGNSLVDMYAKCEMFDEAELIFKSLSQRSTVSWTALISGYVQKGLHGAGLKLFTKMRGANLRADQSTFATVLKASAGFASLLLGKQLHAFIIRSGNLENVFSGSGLVDMYAKCGSIKDAVQVFEEMPDRNAVSWNALISAYADNGDGEAAIGAFTKMIQSGLQPDSVSILGVLIACSHCGFVEQGTEFFQAMSPIYGITPKKKHYACMLDLLGRNGRFAEAEKLMDEMPFEPDEIMWSSVLNACRIYKNQSLAERAAEQLFSMEKLRDAAAYVSMSNIYAAAGKWENVRHVKKAMRERGIKKVPAYSWVEVNHKIHVFSSNDQTHPNGDEIVKKINELTTEIEREGYKPDTSSVVQDIDEQMKIESLKYHSERLAVAFALISTPEGCPIVVMKNLRACRDCHAAIKLISKIVKRVITTQPGFARGMSYGFPKFIKSEGLGGLYKGIGPLWGVRFLLQNVIRKTTFVTDTMMKFASFETIVEMIYKYAIPRPKDQCSKGLQLGAVKKIGLLGLFTRGLPLRIVMIGTLTGAQWGIYDAFKVFVGLPTTGGVAPAAAITPAETKA